MLPLEGQHDEQDFHTGFNRQPIKDWLINQMGRYITQREYTILFDLWRDNDQDEDIVFAWIRMYPDHTESRNAEALAVEKEWERKAPALFDYILTGKGGRHAKTAMDKYYPGVDFTLRETPPELVCDDLTKTKCVRIGGASVNKNGVTRKQGCPYISRQAKMCADSLTHDGYNFNLNGAVIFGMVVGW
ncbi:hypothetical protein PRZ48_004273 [Zasmidium cellare]|uniref:Uncharacterized protein n=1 Tax=Zasmidium cellare TaxID=395010 RepID=A0ABR0EQ78_ZASCE|nr:hypothetical protein PRZ48_004273 [Zasmidium cellare]